MMWKTCAISLLLLLISSGLPKAKGQEANLPSLPEAIQLLQLESMNELRETIQHKEIYIAALEEDLAKLEEDIRAKDEWIVTLTAEMSILREKSDRRALRSKTRCEEEKMELESQKMKDLEKLKTKVDQSETTIVYMTNVMLQSNEVSKEMLGLLGAQSKTIKDAYEAIKRHRNVTSISEAAENTLALQEEAIAKLKSSLVSGLDVPQLSTSDMEQLDVAPFMMDLAILEGQAHMIQKQEKLITQMVPLLRHATEDIIWYEGAEDDSSERSITEGCSCLPRSTDWTKPTPIQIEYHCGEISNRTFSLPCPGGVCLSPELPSCIEPLEWKESEMVSHQCQETTFKGETILCGGTNATKEMRMRIEMGGGTMEEVATSPCLDCSEGLIWTAWQPCTDHFHDGDVMQGRECRKRGNENMGFEDEDRDAIWTPLFSHSAPITLEQTNLVTTLDILPREWMVDFMVKPTSVNSSDIRSILHLTNKPEEINTSRYGGRIPALWFYLGELYIECAEDNGGKRGKRAHTLPQPPIGKWTQITLSQENMSGEARYRVLIDGVEKYNVRNAQDGEFRKVRVYASNPWHDALPGYIKNLSVKSKI